MTYDALARKLRDSGLVTDPWVRGQPRFGEEPLVLPRDRAAALASTARRVAAVFDEVVQIASEEPDLLELFFGLTPVQRAMFQASGGAWHGIARADVFFTSDGVQIAELNCDTPTGLPEAVVLSSIFAPPDADHLDPNVSLERAFLAMLERVREARVGPEGPRTVGIVYPTEFTEDLALIKLYKQWLEAAGYGVALGSPYNLRSSSADPTVRVFDEPVSVLLRHYKTDWWSERASAWRDEELLDTAPLREPLEIALRAELERRTAIVNPFGAVLPQNKRAMAFMWEHIHRFSIESQDVIRAHVPVTSRLEALHPAQLLAQRADWVLKSDYGAEGEEVLIGRDTPEDVWRESLGLAAAGRWIAQRFFEAEVDGEGCTTNFGVFVVAGEPRGLYVRKQVGATDGAALSVPVWIGDSGAPGRGGGPPARGGT
jgi:glutathionylspermidine synthase